MPTRLPPPVAGWLLQGYPTLRPHRLGAWAIHTAALLMARWGRPGFTSQKRHVGTTRLGRATVQSLSHRGAWGAATSAARRCVVPGRSGAASAACKDRGEGAGSRPPLVLPSFVPGRDAAVPAPEYLAAFPMGRDGSNLPLGRRPRECGASVAARENCLDLRSNPLYPHTARPMFDTHLATRQRHT